MKVISELRKMLESIDAIADDIPEEVEADMWVVEDRLSYVLHTLERNLENG